MDTESKLAMECIANEARDNILRRLRSNYNRRSTEELKCECALTIVSQMARAQGHAQKVCFRPRTTFDEVMVSFHTLINDANGPFRGAGSQNDSGLVNLKALLNCRIGL